MPVTTATDTRFCSMTLMRAPKPATINGNGERVLISKHTSEIVVIAISRVVHVLKGHCTHTGQIRGNYGVFLVATEITAHSPWHLLCWNQNDLLAPWLTCVFAACQRDFLMIISKKNENVERVCADKNYYNQLTISVEMGLVEYSPWWNSSD